MTAAGRGLSTVAVAALVAAAYAPLLAWLLERWRAPDGYFSHGPLVPLASAWVAWRRRRELASASAAGEWPGLLLVLPALAMLLASTALRFDSPALASLLLLLPGLAWLLRGRERLRRLAFPLAFLVFALPWPIQLLAGTVQAMKLFVVSSSASLVNAFGGGVAAEGSFLVLPDGGRLLVDDECSGLRSALALLALGVFMAGTARGIAARQRILLALLALPIALAANVLRVSLLAAVGLFAGAPRAGAWHDPSTWGVYAVAIGAYVLLERALRRPKQAAERAPLPPHEGGAAACAGGARILVALVLLASAAAASWRLHRPVEVAGALRLARVPAAAGEWRGEDLEVTDRHLQLLETRDVLLRDYRHGGDDVLACVAVAGPSQKAAHPPEVCYRGQGWRIERQSRRAVELAGREVPLQELVIAKRDERHLVWSWYRVGGEETASWWREQWLAVRARVAGSDPPAALLRFSTPILAAGGTRAAGEETARVRLARFAGAFLPAVDAALAGPAPGGEARSEGRSR